MCNIVTNLCKDLVCLCADDTIHSTSRFCLGLAANDQWPHGSVRHPALVQRKLPTFPFLAVMAGRVSYGDIEFPQSEHLAPNGSLKLG